MMMPNYLSSGNDNNNNHNNNNNNKRSIFDVDNNNYNHHHYQQHNHHSRTQLPFLNNMEEDERGGKGEGTRTTTMIEGGGGGIIMSNSNKKTTITTTRSSSAATNVMLKKGGDDTNNNVEDLLANAMTKMSMEDRTEGLHDLHGVSISNHDDELLVDNDVCKQEESKLNTAIQELNQVLAYNSIMMSAGDSKTTEEESSLLVEAYEKAMEISPSYVDSIKVMILRSEKYDIEKSAKRIMRFFKFKLGLFGQSKLCSDITLEQLDESCHKFLYDGGMQLLNQRDRAGRGIIFIFRNDPKYSTESVMKVFYYLIMSALQDSETQLRGMIMVAYDDYVSPTDDDNKGVNRSKAYADSIKSLPMRLVAMHVCTNNWKMKYITYLFAKLLEKWNLCRFRLHTGTPMEIIYNLMTFGIPKDTIPVDVDGSINRKCHLEILHALETREKQQNNTHHTKPQQQQQQRKQKQKVTSSTAAVIPGGDDEESTVVGGRRPNVDSTYAIDEREHESFAAGIINETPGGSSSNPLSSPNATTTATTSAVVGAPVVDTATTTIGGACKSSSIINDDTEEGSSSLSSSVLIPSPMDILMGRGRQPQSRPGHVRMRHLLWENIDKYNNSSKVEKTKLTNSILISLKESGVRFLRHHSSNGIYTICNDNDAREKISHGFRHLRSIKRSRNNNNVNKGGGGARSTNSSSSGGGSSDDSGCGGVNSTSSASNKKKRK